MARRKICVVTGSRAEYDLLRGLMLELRDDPGCELQVVVTGAHISGEFEGLKIDAKVDLELGEGTAVGITRSTGLGVIGFGEAFSRLKPEIAVVLGDRYEILAAAQAALILRLPLAHLHGGEVTEGAIDEAIRHSITKMSHFHFVAADLYRKRVVQLGEDPERVMNFGALGIDNLRRLNAVGRAELEKSLHFKFGARNLLVTYHPATLGYRTLQDSMTALLAALGRVEDAHFIFTGANADAGGKVINKMIEDFCASNKKRAKFFASLGQARYLSVMKLCDAVVGNSSSGIIEAPAMKIPTVNVGDRQKGRLKATSVIDCDESEAAIFEVIERVLSPEFRKQAMATRSLYGEGETARRIKDYLKTVSLEGVLAKRFHDL